MSFSLPSKRILFPVVLFLPLVANWGCKRPPKVWSLDKATLQVKHVQPKVKPGQGDILLVLEVKGSVQVPPRLVWTPAGGGETTAVAMTPLEGGEKGTSRFQGKLPFLGPGKGIRYHFLIQGPKGEKLRLPGEGELETTCKGGVSVPLLLAHIGAMFLGLLLLLLVAWRCLVFLTKGTSLLSAARMVKFATFFIFLGGLPLGMVVERKVFGTWWEGWPFGRDVTDTKTGVILALWLLLSLRAPSPGKVTEKKAKGWAWMVLAALVFTVVLYIIPHENLKF